MEVSHRWATHHSVYADTDEEADEEDEDGTDWEASVDCGKALIEHAFSKDALGKLGRHETMLANAFTKTLHELRLLQHERSNNKGEVIALPTAVRRSQLALATERVEADAEK